MRHEKIGQTTHIYLDPSEDEIAVLVAITKASFELARPIEDHWHEFMPEAVAITTQGALSRLNLPLRHQSLVLGLDRLAGRMCETFIYKEDDRHFTLANKRFEAMRGDPSVMFERAKQLISRPDQFEYPGPPLSTIRNRWLGTVGGYQPTFYMYEGLSLTTRLGEYGIYRVDGESDWQLRLRAFEQLLGRGKTLTALEFLLGCSCMEWDEHERYLFSALKEYGATTDQIMDIVSRTGACDPLQIKKTRTNAWLN